MLMLEFFESLKVGMIVSKLGWVDLVFFSLTVLGITLGFIRGFARQFSRFVALLITVGMTMHYYEPVAEMVTAQSSIDPVLAKLITFFLLALCVGLIARLIIGLLSKLGVLHCDYVVERFAGGVVGGIHFMIFFCFLSTFASIVANPYIESLYDEKSLSGPVSLSVCPRIHDTSVRIFSAFKKEIEKGSD